MVNFTKTEDCIRIVSVCDIVFVVISITRSKKKVNLLTVTDNFGNFLGFSRRL